MSCVWVYEFRKAVHIGVKQFFNAPIIQNQTNDRMFGFQFLEYIFRSMSTYGILPNCGKQVNLTASSLLLDNMDFKNKDDSPIVTSRARILPKELSRIMKVMVNIIPPFCHSDSGIEDNVRKKEYMTSVENSTFLLKSFTLQFCDLILWYHNYLREHPDKEENAKNWEIIDEKQLRRK